MTGVQTCALPISGVDCFAVANVAEAARLREIGHDADILLLSPTLPTEMPRAVALGLDVTLNSLAEAVALESCAQAAGRRTPVHIKVDTGMGRAGVWHAQARELIAYVRSAPHLVWRGLYTHFAEADADAAFTAVMNCRQAVVVVRHGQCVQRGESVHVQLVPRIVPGGREIVHQVVVPGDAEVRGR